MESVETIQDRLLRYLEGQVLFDRERTKVDPRDPLFDGLLDSLDTLRLVVYIEEQFHVHVEDGEMAPENFESVQRIAEFIRRKHGDLTTRD
jgi:acyl carrier protein